MAIIDQAAVTDGDPIALDARNPTTKFFRACMLVSRRMHMIVRPRLYTQCMYIDDWWRLEALVRSLQTPAMLQGLDSRQPASQSISKLYLAPKDSALDDEDAFIKKIKQLHSLLHLVHSSLKRLIVNMDLNRQFERDRSRLLRSAFEELTNLEEFAQVYHPYQSPTRGSSRPSRIDDLETKAGNVEAVMQPLWPRLQRLAILGPGIASEGLLNKLGIYKNLRSLICVFPERRPDVEMISRRLPATATIFSGDWRPIDPHGDVPVGPVPTGAMAKVVYFSAFEGRTDKNITARDMDNMRQSVEDYEQILKSLASSIKEAVS